MIVDIIFAVLIILTVLLIIYSINQLFRNRSVYNLRIKVIDDILILKPKERHEAIMKYQIGMTYNEMLYRFWIPIKTIERKFRKEVGLT